MNNRNNSSLTANIITFMSVVILVSCSQQRGVEEKKINTATIPVSGEMKAELTAPPLCSSICGR